MRHQSNMGANLLALPQIGGLFYLPFLVKNRHRERFQRKLLIFRWFYITIPATDTRQPSACTSQRPARTQFSSARIRQPSPDIIQRSFDTGFSSAGTRSRGSCQCFWGGDTRPRCAGSRQPEISFCPPPAGRRPRAARGHVCGGSGFVLNCRAIPAKVSPCLSNQDSGANAALPSAAFASRCGRSCSRRCARSRGSISSACRAS